MAVLAGAGPGIELCPAEPQAVLERLRAVLSGGGSAFEVVPDALADEERRFFDAHSSGPGVALVVRTSGSTGHPKRVGMSAAALHASALATQEALGAGQWLLALPVNYIAGILVLARGLLAGTSPVIMTGEHFRPAEFVARARELGPGRRFTALVPAQVYALLEDPAATAALAMFDAVLVGGQRFEPDLAARCAAAGVRTVATYGGSETAGGCVYDGHPIGDTRIRIINGVVWLSGSMLATRYVGDATRTRAAFHHGDDGLWYRTGDLGHLQNGELIVTGREDHIIISGGLKLDLDEVESVLHGLPGLETAVVAAFADERWGTRFAGYADGRSRQARLDLPHINRVLHERIGRHATAAAFTYLDFGLPFLQNGKVDRASLARTAAALARHAQPDVDRVARRERN